MRIEFKVIRKPKGFAKEGLEIVRKKATEVLEKRLGSIVCSVHNEPPHLTVSIDSQGRFAIDRIETCCQEFKEEVKRMIKEAA